MRLLLSENYMADAICIVPQPYPQDINYCFHSLLVVCHSPCMCVTVCECVSLITFGFVLSQVMECATIILFWLFPPKTSSDERHLFTSDYAVIIIGVVCQ